MRSPMLSGFAVLCPTYAGLGAISFTVWPYGRNCRAQSCAPEQASMPITHGGSWAISSTSMSRATFGLTSTALPLSSMPRTAKTFFARSIPTVIVLIDLSFRGFDVIEKSRHGTRCRLRLPPQPRDGEVPSIRWAAQT